MKPFLALILCVAVFVTQTSCGPRTCTLIGCSSGVSVTVNLPADHRAAEGSYVATVGGWDFAFDISSTGSISSDCLGRGPSTSGLTCFLSSNTRGPPPDQVEIVITRDTTEVLRQTVSTHPQDVFPNGVECGAVCSQGSASVTLP